jgi:CheY-like chemotaxis protein
MSPSKPFVLVAADDNPDDRLLLQTAWEETAPVTLHLVEDGKELIDLLYGQGKYTGAAVNPPPNLIILDLKMPRKNGHETLQEIKAHPVLREIPVVVLTTSNAESDIARSYELGASVCATKPESFEDLLQFVQMLYQTWLKA